MFRKAFERLDLTGHPGVLGGNLSGNYGSSIRPLRSGTYTDKCYQ